MGSSPISEFKFRNADGEELASPEEWRSGYLDLGPHQWDLKRVQVLRNGISLPISYRLFISGPRLVADWPRSPAGHYRLETHTPEGVSARTITVGPRKISANAFEHMLEDLDLNLPTRVAVALQSVGALAGVKITPPAEATLAQELYRLKRAIEGTPNRKGLPSALSRISRDPYQVLCSTELSIRRDLARRPHLGRVTACLAIGRGVDERGLPTKVIDSRVEHSADVYENRLVRTFYELVRRRLCRLRSAVTAIQSPISTEVERLVERLRLARQEAAFLDGVRLPTSAPLRVTMVLMRRPDYRAAFEGYLEFCKSCSVRLDEPTLDLPLENLPVIYQIWGTLQILLVLLETAKDLGFRTVSQQLVGRDRSGLYVRLFPGNGPVLILEDPVQGAVVRLRVTPSYEKQGVLRSISRPQRPDISLEIVASDRPPLLYLFDPKYKLEGEDLQDCTGDLRPTKTDIDKMHAYRDAIRDQDERHVVRYAAILYPGPTEEYAAGIAALQAYPGKEDELKVRVMDILSTALQEGVAVRDSGNWSTRGASVTGYSASVLMGNGSKIASPAARPARIVYRRIQRARYS